MNYWEKRKSFWNTPKGLLISMLILITILTGTLIALNLFSSPYPVIEYFDADPVVISGGQSSNLSWSVQGATSINIDQGVGKIESRGFSYVSPSETTIYTLTAINGTRNRIAEVKVMVA